MVNTLIKLQLALTKNSFTQSTGLLVAKIFGIIFAVLYGAGTLIVLVAARFSDTQESVATWLPLAFSILSVVFVLMVLLFFGSDQTLDPARFAIFPVRARDLIPGMLLIGTLLSLGGIFVTVLSVGYVIASSWTVPQTIIAGICAALGVVTMVIWSRVLVSWLAAGLSKRHTRDMAGVIFAILIIVPSLLPQIIGSMKMGNNQVTEIMGSVMAWLPWGWAWAAPWDVVANNWLLAAIRMFLAVALLALGIWGWARALDRALQQPIESSGSSEKVKAHGIVDRICPNNVWGAIAARSLHYWKRDPRHFILIIFTLIIPVLWFGPVIFGDLNASKSVLFAAPAVATMFFGQTAFYELSYDGSALWTHIVAGIRGRDDRLGRIWAILLVLGPTVLIVQLAVLLLVPGSWQAKVGSVAATIVFAGAGLGAGSLVGSFFNVPSPPPGANMFAKKSGGGWMAMLMFMAVAFISLVSAIPTLILVFIGQTGASIAALPVAIITAVAIAAAGVIFGGKKLENNWPELLAQISDDK